MTTNSAPTSRGEPFAPEGLPWVRVSPRLATIRRLRLVVLIAVLAAGTAVATWFAKPALAVLPAVVGVALIGWGWWVIGRAVGAWGYAEREDDLLVTRGILLRRLVVVPYGRMQFVDVTAGPLERRFGLASVQLHTAAASTDAQIPGLSPAEAARLRDRLAARGEARSAGI